LCSPWCPNASKKNRKLLQSRHPATPGIFLLYELCYISRVMKKRRFLQTLVAGGAVSLVSTRSLQSRLSENRVLVTQDPNSTIVPVVEPTPVKALPV